MAVGPAHMGQTSGYSANPVLQWDHAVAAGYYLGGQHARPASVDPAPGTIYAASAST